MKQVVVIRKDLNMRKGKMIAQGAHASLGVFRQQLMVFASGDKLMNGSIYVPKEWLEWLQGLQKKICVGVDSENELLLTYENAKLAGLPCYKVLDQGLTEFKEPTWTAVAIGHAEDHHVDAITGQLKLL
jgi:PTH2 family peptidyl-tRNA hydrolase